MSRLVDEAVLLARDICQNALWDAGACTFLVHTYCGPGVGFRWARTSRGLYSGTTGTAVFLADLASITGDASARKVAKGAMMFALAAEGSCQPDLSFFGGATGVAYGAWRVGVALDDDELCDAAREVLLRIDGSTPSRCFDVIGGAAGAIPPLLWMDRRPAAVLM